MIWYFKVFWWLSIIIITLKFIFLIIHTLSGLFLHLLMHFDVEIIHSFRLREFKIILNEFDIYIWWLRAVTLFRASGWGLRFREAYIQEDIKVPHNIHLLIEIKVSHRSFLIHEHLDLVLCIVSSFQDKEREPDPVIFLIFFLSLIELFLLILDWFFISQGAGWGLKFGRFKNCWFGGLEWGNLLIGNLCWSLFSCLWGVVKVHIWCFH